MRTMLINCQRPRYRQILVTCHFREITSQPELNEKIELTRNTNDFPEMEDA